MTDFFKLSVTSHHRDLLHVSLARSLMQKFSIFCLALFSRLYELVAWVLELLETNIVRSSALRSTLHMAKLSILHQGSVGLSGNPWPLWEPTC